MGGVQTHASMMALSTKSYTVLDATVLIAAYSENDCEIENYVINIMLWTPSFMQVNMLGFTQIIQFFLFKISKFSNVYFILIILRYFMRVLLYIPRGFFFPQF